jgi:hypothetical protein
MGENLEMRAEAGAKTPEVKIDIVDAIATFIETYELIIRPHLKEGDVEVCVPAIDDLRMKFAMAEGKIDFPSGAIYAHYKIALNYLAGLAGDPGRGARHMAGEMARRQYLDCIDRQVSMLDIAMKSLGGGRYQRLREKFVKPLELADREDEE